MLNFEEDNMAVAPMAGLGLQAIAGFMPASPGPASVPQERSTKEHVSESAEKFRRRIALAAAAHARAHRRAGDARAAA